MGKGHSRRRRPAGRTTLRTARQQHVALLPGQRQDHRLPTRKRQLAKGFGARGRRRLQERRHTGQQPLYLQQRLSLPVGRRGELEQDGHSQPNQANHRRIRKPTLRADNQRIGLHHRRTDLGERRARQQRRRPARKRYQPRGNALEGERQHQQPDTHRQPQRQDGGVDQGGGERRTRRQQRLGTAPRGQLQPKDPALPRRIAGGGLRRRTARHRKQHIALLQEPRPRTHLEQRRPLCHTHHTGRPNGCGALLRQQQHSLF